MTGPSTIAILVLLGLGPPLALPQAGLAQELIDPAAAVEQALESGGVPAMPDVPVEVLEPVTPPAEAPPAPPPAPPDLAAPAAPPDSPDSPDSPDPPAPDLGGEDISETAPAPAPESPPTAPVNLNVDIRILSPGDDGGVDQGSGVPVEAELPGGAVPGEADLEFNWEWRWERACEPDFHAASVTLNWVWEWVDGCEAAVGTSPIQSNPGLLTFPEAVSAPPGGSDETALDQGLTIVLEDRRQPSGGVRSSVAPAAAPEPFSAGPGADRAPVADRAGRPALAARPETREPLSKERDFPERLPMLPAATAAPAGAGGSSATVAVALLALLCLLVPRVLEPARARPRKLSSLLSSGRLERPG